MTRRRSSSSTKQTSLELPAPKPTWGGRRAGAGRPSRKGTSVPHARRPFHEQDHPVHVTMSASKKVGRLRRLKVAGAIGQAIRKASTHEGTAAQRRRRTFRVIHFSIQHDHLHLVVEASSARALSRGMQGLAARIARRVNEALGRRGQVFRERYHARALATPLEVRRAITYVLTNAAKHERPRDVFPDRDTMVVDGIDPCSSARWFAGWKRPPPPDPSPSPTVAPRTWLLTKGWRRHGLLGRHEQPL
jgi:REP element-mobilizing transposase RayT